MTLFKLLPLLCFWLCLEPTFAESNPPKFSTLGYLHNLPAWQFIPGGKLAFLGSDLVDTKTQSIKGRFMVGLFSPEKLAQMSQGPKVLDLAHQWDFIRLPSSKVFNVLEGYSTGGSHIAVGFDPRFAEGPIPVSAPDKCQEDQVELSSEGVFECYRLILFFPKQTPLRLAPVEFGKFEVYQSEIAVVIDRQKYKIVSASFLSDSPFHPVTAMSPNPTAPKTVLQAFTLTVTSDSRLLFFAPTDRGFKDPNFAGIQFIFNEKPWITSQWSSPLKLAYLHKYALKKEVCLDAQQSLPDCNPEQKVRFSERYSLAQFPIRMPDGTHLGPNQTTFCSYPWITPDGSEMFCQVFRNNGMAAVGRRTLGTFKLLDGFFNQQDTFPSFGDGHHRITSLGTGSGVWAAYPGANLNFSFPLTGKRNKQILLVKTAGNKSVYGEADMDDFMDGNYLLYLPMNRMIENCGGACSESRDLYRTFRYKSGLTPDTSGFFHTASLSTGAVFTPGRTYGDAHSQQKPDFSEFQGQGIVFPASSEVRIHNPRNGPLSLAHTTYTIQLAIKPLIHLAAEERLTIARKDQAWKISLKTGNQLTISTYINRRDIEHTLPLSLPPNQWSHVVLEFMPIKDSQGFTLGLNVYLDGKRFLPSGKSNTVVFDLPRSPKRYFINGNTKPIQLGPSEFSGKFNGQILILDEFAISRVRRSPAEIELAAHLVSENKDFQSGFYQVGGKALPQGLNAHELKIPRELVPYINNSDAITLGERLFSDPNLSGSRTMSCRTCHQPEKSFTDGLALPVNGNRNTPTLFNRAFSTVQFFNGRSSDLVAQALQPIVNPNEMNANLDTVLTYLKTNREISAAFRKLFNQEQVTPQRLAIVLAAFEVSLLSGNSAVDHLNSYDSSSSSVQQLLQGKLVFEGKGRCIGCHSGSNFSDELFYNTGTGSVSSKGEPLRRFKTPTLRNIALTAPYFHDGSKSSLDDVIEFYNQGGIRQAFNPMVSPEIVPLGLTEDEKIALRKFLEGLTGR